MAIEVIRDWSLSLPPGEMSFIDLPVRSRLCSVNGRMVQIDLTVRNIGHSEVLLYETYHFRDGQWHEVVSWAAHYHPHGTSDQGWDEACAEAVTLAVMILDGD